MRVERSERRERFGGGSGVAREQDEAFAVRRVLARLGVDFEVVRLSRSLWNLRFVVERAMGCAMLSGGRVV
jgi:hypothetical protein